MTIAFTILKNTDITAPPLGDSSVSTWAIIRVVATPMIPLAQSSSYVAYHTVVVHDPHGYTGATKDNPRSLTMLLPLSIHPWQFNKSFHQIQCLSITHT